MVPTHQHMDGGLYRLHATDISGKGDQYLEETWRDGVLYQCIITAKMFWTTEERWDKRFTKLDGPLQVHQTELKDDEGVIASFTFARSDAQDICHMLVTANVQRNSAMSMEMVDHIKRVLKTQAEAIQAGLFENRDADAPDFLSDVNRFHAKFGQERLDEPLMLPADLHDFRTKFHKEETDEYEAEYSKLVDAVFNRDHEAVVKSLDLQLDALCDAVWVILGTADVQFGRRRFFEAWRRVVTANMSKVLATEDPTAADSGREVKYDVRKPIGWTAPDHRDLVQDHCAISNKDV